MVSPRIAVLCAGLALVATPVLAWESMAAALLAGHTVSYEGAQQSFSADGTTVYTTQKPSLGRWRDEGGRYCSTWPPADSWACYGLEREGDRVRFIAESGEITEGTID